MKVAQHEVLGNDAKEISVPAGTIETFGSRSLCRSPASEALDRPMRDGPPIKR
jgi:hypothetical protein